MGFMPFTYLCLVVVGLGLFYLYTKTGKAVRCMLFTLASGLGALALVWVIGRFAALTIGVTPLTILVAAVLGVPGVVGMLVLNLY